MENNIDVTYKAAFFEKTEIRLCTIKTQKHINSDAIKLLRLRSMKEPIPDGVAINNSNNFIQNNNTIKHIDNVKNGFIDSKYFFIFICQL